MDMECSTRKVAQQLAHGTAIWSSLTNLDEAGAGSSRHMGTRGSMQISFDRSSSAIHFVCAGLKASAELFSINCLALIAASGVSFARM